MVKLREETRGATANRDVDQSDTKLWIPETFQGGNFKGLVPWSQKYPVMETASMRALRLIRRLGQNHTETVNNRQLYGNESLICWRAFDDFYGIAPTVDRLVKMIAAAALNTEYAYQVIFMQGGPSTAKSALANRIKQLFVESEPALRFADSKVRAHPIGGFAMIPVLADMMAKSGRRDEAFDFRGQFLKELDLDQDGALRFRSDSLRIFKKAGLEPSFANMCKIESGEDFLTVLIDALGYSRSIRAIAGFPDMSVYEPLFRVVNGGGDPIKQLAALPISSFLYSHGDYGSEGISEVKETQPYKFDLSEVIGDEEMRAAFMRNPNAEEMVRMIGAYCMANRGVLNWVEMAKAAVEAIRSILDLTQDRRARYPMPYNTRTWMVDLIFFAQTNTKEYWKLVKAEGNEPYRDRFGRLDVLQPISAAAIRPTMTKMLGRSEAGNAGSDEQVIMDPLIEELGSLFLSAGRIRLPEKYSLKIMQVADALAGNYYLPVDKGSRASAAEIIKDLGPLQGKDGPTLRFEAKLEGLLLASSYLNGEPFVLSKDFFEELDRELTTERLWEGEDPSKDSEKEPPTSEIGKLHLLLKVQLTKRRKRRLAQMVRIAFRVAQKDSEEGESNLQQVYAKDYIRGIELLSTDPGKVPPKVRDFVNSIDAQIGIPSAGRDSVREQVISELKSMWRTKMEAIRKDGLETRQFTADDLEEMDIPLNQFPPLKRAIDRLIASEIKPDAVLRFLGSKTEKSAGLSAAERIFGMPKAMAEKIFKEVQDFNYLQEMGTDEEDYR